MPHRKYRALESDCRVQAAITGHKKTKAELQKMAREYKVLADWLEAHPQEHEGSPATDQPTD
ncbi:hypothetical protein [Bradyrhizobium guangdongense]|uniref:Uncharacterized protein n=1 Tax=Bradyrhizobium guangdongense TaxID=1325090 RepID=A0A410VCV7_9BRAD|nr:hypothetical protein [Bradyrhizobium guangdongense]QAU41514.1 hypothetical protein X265_30355 [Bradyrhizobium guangdongense]QOZ62577.1 hypothetical protein XH86_30395 [Bradyrhizobium guangdongense]GGI31678.1 hypothetical protein GCM10010987_65610 [Bradyrhizobium guangdongense]